MMNKEQATLLTLSTSWDRMRNMCIKHEFYTLGTCEEYENLMRFVFECEIEMNEQDLIHIVRDIASHSDLFKLGYSDSQEMYKHVEYCILNEATYITSDIEY